MNLPYTECACNTAELEVFKSTSIFHFSNSMKISTYAVKQDDYHLVILSI